MIYSNYILLLLLFLLKKNHPKNVMSPSKRRFHRDNTEEQVELNRVDNDDHVIPMENDYINNNTVDDDGTNRLIQDLFNAPMDDDVNLEEDNLQDDKDDSDECCWINPLVQTPMDLPRSTSRDLERSAHIKITFPKLRDYKIQRIYLLDEV